jgi:hypothetical protein
MIPVGRRNIRHLPVEGVDDDMADLVGGRDKDVAVAAARELRNHGPSSKKHELRKGSRRHNTRFVEIQIPSPNGSVSYSHRCKEDGWEAECPTHGKEQDL